MKKLTVAALILALAACMLVACGKKTDRIDDRNPIDYQKEHDFEVSSFDDDDYLYFAPKDEDPSYGLLFYVGTAIDASSYSYLGNALAKQGFLVAIAKQAFAFVEYRDVEPVMSKYPHVKFFVGGHSQGGGAAVRRVAETPYNFEGVLLFAPLCFNHDAYDDEGEYLGKEYYNVKGISFPTLLLEGSNDGVLSASMKAAYPECFDFLERHVITPGTHMSFSTLDGDSAFAIFEPQNVGAPQEQLDEQRSQTVIYSLSFMRRVIDGAFTADAD